MDAIAVKSGLARGTIYLYFDSKEHVFLSLLAQGYALLEAKLPSDQFWDFKMRFVAQIDFDADLREALMEYWAGATGA